MRKAILVSVWFGLLNLAFAADNPWLGTWKPDVSMSNYIEVNGSLVISSPAEGVLKWGTDEISEDGKTLTATSWMAGAQSKARIEIFRKQ